ncbi:MAG TPA: YraN family protein [Terriglobia bacterium]|nr:YraN family protein [Terriglobia bacterium]
MVLLARAVYRLLVWRERRSAQRAQGRPTMKRSGRRQPQNPQQDAAHLEAGRRGEMLAYWYLRQAGYTVVARNRRPGLPREHQPGPTPGELDLVAWDGPVLAFVEVKTRRSVDSQPDARLVQAAQRERIVRSARGYVRRLRRAGKITYRFDVIVVAWNPTDGYTVRLVKDAFKPAGPQRMNW